METSTFFFLGLPPIFPVSTRFLLYAISSDTLLLVTVLRPLHAEASISPASAQSSRKATASYGSSYPSFRAATAAMALLSSMTAPPLS